MPNWCQNRLTLTGPRAVLEEIAATGLSLMKLVPPPNGQWDYGWCCDNWGTKWDPEIDVGNVDIDGDDTEATLDVGFDSAWAPPVEAWVTVWRRYAPRGLSVRLEYLEEGMAFAGVLHCTSDDNLHEYVSLSDSWDEPQALAKSTGNSLIADMLDLRDEMIDLAEAAQ